MDDLQKAYTIMSAADGHVSTNADFQIVAPVLREVGMPLDDIINFLRRSPGFDSDAITRVKSFKQGGGLGIGSLVKWAKERFGFVPKWGYDRHDTIELTSYPSPFENSAKIAPKFNENQRKEVAAERYKPKQVPQKYALLSGVEQLKLWARAVRSDDELTQIAAAFSGQGRKTTLLSVFDMTEARDFAEIESAIGANFAKDTGAWVMINPVHDTEGNKESVSKFKYLLWEADEGTPEEQWGAIVDSRLPIDAVIQSGNKSIHAWIRVDAKDAEQYDEIAKRVYAALKTHGAKLDESCKNANRLCRLPGVQRGDKYQTLVAIRGDFADAKESISDWLEWEEIEHMLPDDDAPDFDASLDARSYIVGDVVQKGDLVCIGGDQKIGKSWITEQLAAELVKPSCGSWLGMPIRPKGNGEGYRVYFVNAEIKKEVFNDRITSLMKACNSVRHSKNFKSVTLRNVSQKISAWAKELIYKIKKFRADIVFIDPIYTLIDGDENSAEDVTALMIILRKIATICNVTMFITHHHRKGDMELLDIAQRLSGSNAVARYVDTIIDLAGINPEYLRQGGIETAIEGEDGIKRVNVRGLCIEYMLRNTLDIAPRYFWRFDGGNFKEDKTGALETAWRNKLKTRLNELQISGIFAMFDDRVKLSDYADIGTRGKFDQAQTGDVLVETRLKEAAKANVPLTIKAIAELTGLTVQRVRQIIKTLSEKGLISDTNPDRQGNEPPTYIWNE